MLTTTMFNKIISLIEQMRQLGAELASDWPLATWSWASSLGSFPPEQVLTTDVRTLSIFSAMGFVPRLGAKEQPSMARGRYLSFKSKGGSWHQIESLLGFIVY